MSDLKLTWMATELRAAGLTVKEHTGWRTRSADKPYGYTPVGVINHHTAGSAVLTNYPDPPYYRDAALEFACNLTVRPDGTVVCLNAGIANDSGMGDPAVLERVRQDQPVKPPTDKTAWDRVTGNPWFIDIEVQHLGDGSPINPPQREALIVTNAILLDHYGWNPMSRLIGHREWTLRKVDPRWDGMTNPMPGIRADTEDLMEGDDMPTAEEIREIVREELDRLLDGRPGPANGFYGVGQAVATTPIGRTNPDTGKTPPLPVGGYLQKTYVKVKNLDEDS